jgi:3-hydroxyisobutyrate dehydrogenase-like beta-hydroxyacid dehydrogenase
MAITIGFIGFGEAAFNIAKGLHRAGLSDLCAYDVLVGSPDAGSRLHKRARQAGVRLLGSLADVLSEADVVFSAVVAAAAIEVAEEAAPLLSPHHFFVDINSVSPATMKQVAEAVDESGAHFVEAAVMGAVPIYGHRVPMLLAGEAAQELVELMSPWEMQLQVVGKQVGQACVIKMFRIVLIKGVEALILECLLAASKYGVEEKVLASAMESMAGFNWSEWSDYTTRRTALHAERRAREMDDVARTLESLGVEPMMSLAAARRFHWVAELGLKERFEDQPPQKYKDVISAIREAVSP